ncbi:alpha/beta fold hydrolase [Streptomyces sp. NPDC015032]|uniref:alpha/beta fold hydrolase n=1 Tax=Streptomyces sp. NPDC015032 TaxID=3364937 RepID=UPI0036FB3AA8
MKQERRHGIRRSHHASHGVRRRGGTFRPLRRGGQWSTSASAARSGPQPGGLGPLQAALPGYRLLAIDLPGFGQSRPLPDCRLASLAGHVEQVLDRLEAASGVHVVGNSLGGAVAMQLTVRAPARVSSLTLLNCAGFGREVTWALRILGLPLLWRLLLRPDEGSARHTERSLFIRTSHTAMERSTGAPVRQTAGLRGTLHPGRQGAQSTPSGHRHH